MSSGNISQPEMEALVRRILDGADLSKTTGAIVRKEVQKILGNQAGDRKALKLSIRAALSVVLSDVTPVAGKGGARDGGAGEREKEVGDKAGEKEKDIGRAQAGMVEGESDSEGEGEGDGEDAGGDNGDGENASGGDSDFAPDKDEEVRPAVSRKRRKRVAIEEDDEGEEYVADSGAGADNGEKEEEKDDADDLNESAGDDEGETRKRRERLRAPSPLKPAKRVRSHQSTTEKQLERLRSVCKQLGCMVPPARMRGKNVAEKCTAVVDFLAQKGVHTPNPTMLTRREIAGHRARLEKEKELAGLDTSNIITDKGRPRRSRGRTVPAKQDIDLPSDYSGPELTGSSDEEEEEEDYKADSSEDE